MQALIWIGAVVTLGGVLGLLRCGQLSLQAKTLPEDAAKALMARVVRLNLGAMGVAVLGLMTTVAGLFLR